MEGENATEISLKISKKEICYQYYYEDEYWDKEKKRKKTAHPQTRMIQHEWSVVPRLKNPGIKTFHVEGRTPTKARLETFGKSQMT